MRQVKAGRSQKLGASTIRRISSDNAPARHQANSWNNKLKKTGSQRCSAWAKLYKYYLNLKNLNKREAWSDSVGDLESQELTELPVKLGTSTCKIQSWSIKKICVIFSLSDLVVMIMMMMSHALMCFLCSCSLLVWLHENPLLHFALPPPSLNRHRYLRQTSKVLLLALPLDNVNKLC